MSGGGAQPSLLVGTTNRHPLRMVAARATCRRHGAGAARAGGEAARWGERSASSTENGRATLVAGERVPHPETLRSDASVRSESLICSTLQQTLWQELYG